MKHVLPGEITHTIKFVPRYYTTDTVTLELINVTTKEKYTEQCAMENNDGIMSIVFNYDFVERDRYTIKVLEAGNILYRGNIFATEQEAQDFTITDNYIEYE